MPTADILTIADAVVTAINAASLSQSVTAVRSYIATRELSDDSGLTVTVMPAADAAKRDSRKSSQHHFTLHVGVQQKVADKTNATIDPLMLLTQEMADLFLYQRAGNAVLVMPDKDDGQPAIRVLFNEQHLRDLDQFTAVIQLTFKAWREPS